MRASYSAVLWLRETRANFLVLPFALVAIGGAAASRSGRFGWGSFLLTLAGVILAHVSVNLFNEYSDWRTGIDEHTMKTPFSGGSGTLQAGLLRPSAVLAASWGSLAVAFLIGVWLTWMSGWEILPLMAAGGVTILLYTDVFAKLGIGEPASGITLGSFVVIGTYFVQTGAFDAGIIWASVPPGLLTALLLYLNEFPDADADRAGGRRHLVILLGKRRAAFLYAFAMGCVYLSIVLGVIVGGLPAGTLAGFATLPFALRAAAITFRSHDDAAKMVPALGANVAVVLGTDFLIAAGFFLG
jgi:1,4-dihydroxy-2-naphthoate polyprenyltransferase